jgi:hypothetical protein
MSIFEEFQQRAVGDEYEAVFRYEEREKQFIVQSTGLYDNYDRLNLGCRLNIRFFIEPNTYTFMGRPLEKQRSGGLVMIEQVTDIETINPRKYDRDELRLNVQVFGLPESRIHEAFFEKPGGQPDMSDVTFDLSAGGVCVISNTLLSSKCDPYYLLTFSLSDKDKFALPAKVVRRSNYPRTKIGRYDYGFQFIFDKMPDEKGRLSRAILTRKLAIR